MHKVLSRFLYGLFAGLLLLLTACSTADDFGGVVGVRPGQPPIVFGTTACGEATASPSNRAARAVTGIPLETTYKDFGVWAWKHYPSTGATQRVLFHGDGTPYEVRRGTEAWNYADLLCDGTEQIQHYWDASADQYDFTAYAPFRLPSDGTGVGTQTAADGQLVLLPSGNVGINRVEGHVPSSAAADWLVARTRRTIETPVGEPVLVKDYDLLAEGAPEMIDSYRVFAHTVPLVFHHLLSLIEIRAYNKKGTRITVENLSITFASGDEIYTRAAYDPDAATQKWTYDETSLQATLLPTCQATISGDENAPTLLGKYVEIPQAMSSVVDGMPKSRLIHISMKLGNETVTTTFPLINTTAFAPGWDAGMRYIYTLVFSGTQEIILVDLNMEKYHWKEGHDIDAGTQTHW